MNSNGAQDWRAVAIIAAGGERLLCLGESASQVRAAYIGAWSEVIRDEDRPTVKQISLQKWTGKVWQGQWDHQDFLKVPSARVARISDDESIDEGDLGDVEDDLDIHEEMIAEVEAEVEAEGDED